MLIVLVVLLSPHHTTPPLSPSLASVDTSQVNPCPCNTDEITAADVLADYKAHGGVDLMADVKPEESLPCTTRTVTSQNPNTTTPGTIAITTITNHTLTDEDVACVCKRSRKPVTPVKCKRHGEVESDDCQDEPKPNDPSRTPQPFPTTQPQPFPTAQPDPTNTPETSPTPAVTVPPPGEGRVFHDEEVESNCVRQFRGVTHTHPAMSLSSCAEMNWKIHFDSHPNANALVCLVAKIPSCYPTVTFATAESICHTNGARLCTTEELRTLTASECSDSDFAQWSSDACQPPSPSPPVAPRARTGLSRNSRTNVRITHLQATAVTTTVEGTLESVAVNSSDHSKQQPQQRLSMKTLLKPINGQVREVCSPIDAASFATVRCCADRFLGDGKRFSNVSCVFQEHSLMLNQTEQPDDDDESDTQQGYFAMLPLKITSPEEFSMVFEVRGNGPVRLVMTSEEDDILGIELILCENNNRSEVRYGNERYVLVSGPTSLCLSPTVFRKFWLSYHRSTLEVGRGDLGSGIVLVQTRITRKIHRLAVGTNSGMFLETRRVCVHSGPVLKPIVPQIDVVTPQNIRHVGSRVVVNSTHDEKPVVPKTPEMVLEDEMIISNTDSGCIDVDVAANNEVPIARNKTTFRNTTVAKPVEVPSGEDGDGMFSQSRIPLGDEIEDDVSSPSPSPSPYDIVEQETSATDGAEMNKPTPSLSPSLTASVSLSPSPSPTVSVVILDCGDGEQIEIGADQEVNRLVDMNQ
eukprot:c9679_g1_i1.p1 GENE.c9679_g1_i1~~c9679_g1_i1.p1  ORF type:complete len:749 (-),score=214.18 c9679_g1_i1:15-2261(-)